MRYPFPIITNISQVLEAVEGRKEFVVAERDGYTVVNYLINLADTFPEIALDSCGHYASKNDELYAIRRECRGITFCNKTGQVISRKFHKFFNVQERSETSLQHIDLSLGHKILTKLDGSMITPILLENKVRWCTKMGITPVSGPVEDYVARFPQYEIFARDMIDRDLTPIFEWCSRQQRIILDYPIDSLILLAIRENVTGRYLTLEEINHHATGMRVVEEHTYKSENIGVLIETTSPLKDAEGWVIRFDDGHMVKLKCEWYLKLHKNKEALRFEKDVVSLIVENKTDDIKPFLSDVDKKRLEDYEQKFWAGFDETLKQININSMSFKSICNNDKKTFALSIANKLDPFLKNIYFQLFHRTDSREMLLEVIAKNTSTSTTVQAVRHLWGGHDWAEETNE